MHFFMPIPVQHYQQNSNPDFEAQNACVLQQQTSLDLEFFYLLNSAKLVF
jgi:hypothetical protein